MTFKLKIRRTMLKINKNNAIVGLIGFLPALLTTRLTSLGDILIFYVIMFAYTAFFVFCKEEVFPYENEGEYVPVSRSRIHFAWGADWLVFLLPRPQPYKLYFQASCF